MRKLAWIFNALAIGLIVGMVQAQGSATCSQFLAQALSQLGDNCDALDRNSACYGYTLVQAALTSDAPEIAFNEPRDRAGLSQVLSLRTSGLDQAQSTWGIAVLNTQANLPGTLPGQGVVMMLLGDAEITGQVRASDLPEIEPITANVTESTEGVRVRTGAGFNFNIIDVIPPGEAVTVEGRSKDGEWLRVVANDRAGWMFAELLETPLDPADLIVVEDIIQSPMQAFYFRSGIGSSNCEEAPDSLMVQSPQGMPVTLTVNESEITISSTVVIETRDDNTMILYVIDGQAVVNNLIVPQGWKAFVPIEIRDDLLRALQDEEIEIIRIISDGVPRTTGPWETCEVIDEEDRVWLSTLTDIDPDLLNYPIQNPPDATSICAPPEFFITLNQSVDCSGFVATSPLDGMDWGMQQFYWDPAEGAAGYEVTVYDQNGNVVGTATTTNTTAELDTAGGSLAGIYNYTWQVAALNDNQDRVCETNPVTIPRGAKPPPPTSEPAPESEPVPESEPTPEITTPEPPCCEE